MMKFIGVIFLIIAFVIKTCLNHNVEYFSTIYTINMLLNIMGILILTHSFFKKHEKLQPVSLFLDPKRCIKWGFSTMGIVFVCVILIFGLQQLGQKTNDLLL